jgi:hypothetical protein
MMMIPKPLVAILASYPMSFHWNDSILSAADEVRRR